jgi:hypothetical protein
MIDWTAENGFLPCPYFIKRHVVQSYVQTGLSRTERSSTAPPLSSSRGLFPSSEGMSVALVQESYMNLCALLKSRICQVARQVGQIFPDDLFEKA